jgi:ABC-type oligopeptide transport system substrate-binding subunit
MKTRKIMLLIVALAMLALLATACNKNDTSTNGSSNSSANSNSSSTKSSSSSSGTSSTVSKRFVGIWVEEGKKDDQGGKFTDDGKIIDMSDNKQVGTYTTTGDDKATITIGESGTANATLESDTRMKLVMGGETTYLTKK